MKKIIIFFIFALVFFLSGQIEAAEELIFDSTDHYLGACQLTNKAGWELDKDVNVNKFQVWYNWNKNETTISVTISKDGEKFAEFEATRSECDPYQQQWCNANYQIDKIFPKGKYLAEIPDSRMCLKPGKTGTIRLYKDGESVKPQEPSPTVQAVVKPTIIPASQTNTCSCNQTTILATAAITSAITSILIAFFLRR